MQLVDDVYESCSEQVRLCCFTGGRVSFMHLVAACCSFTAHLLLLFMLISSTTVCELRSVRIWRTPSQKATWRCVFVCV